MSIFATTQQFTILDCPSCGIEFGISELFEARKREKGDDFYCTNGHCMSFGNSTIKQLKLAKKRLEDERARHGNTQRGLDTANRSRAALKGQVTRVKNRVANGRCPCCRKVFKDLGDHMHSQHPDWVDA